MTNTTLPKKEQILDMDTAATTEIIPNLFIGNMLSTCDRNILETNQINSIISLISGRTASSPIAGHPLKLWTRRKFTDYIKPGHHLWIECTDSLTQDLLVHMSTVCDFIDKNLQVSGRPSESMGRVLVHCQLGISRSSTMVIVYLMRTLHKSRDDALAQVRLKWPRAEPNANFWMQLEIWERVGYNVWMDEEKKVPKIEYQVYLTQRDEQLEVKDSTGNNPEKFLDFSCKCSVEMVFHMVANVCSSI